MERYSIGKITIKRTWDKKLTIKIIFFFLLFFLLNIFLFGWGESTEFSPLKLPH